eukprot:750152_1
MSCTSGTVTHLMSEQTFSQPNYYGIWPVRNSSYSSPLINKAHISAIVTPPMAAKPSVIPPPSRDRFDANCNSMIEPISHLAPPGPSLFAMPPPFIFEAEEESGIGNEEEMWSSDASFGD